MAKLIILSIVIISFTLPVWLSTSLQPRRAIRRTQWIMLLTIVVWAWLCARWYPELVTIE